MALFGNIFSKSKSQLGIDIGTSNIKLVELEVSDRNFSLKTYGIATTAYNLAGKESKQSIAATSEILKELLKRTSASSRKCVASLPNSVVFTSAIDLPKIPENEMKKAIEFEAKKYIPLPIEEVALSWIPLEKPVKISRQTNLGQISDDKQKILLTAVPKIVIDNYQAVFQTAGITVSALEIEALALIRSIIGDDISAILLIDIGAKSTSVNLVDNGYLRLSKSLNVGGDTITNSLSKSLSVNFARAEQFKKDFGMTQTASQMPQVMRPILDIIKSEALQLINLFESHGDRIGKIVLSGAGSKLPGIDEYFSGLGKPVVMANPLAKLIFPAEIRPIVEPLGANLSVAIGLAMRPT
jgi:type IV pilus assembly protein PilM